VDVNALQQGKTNGVYVVDNQAALGSINEGSPTLNTIVTTGSSVCWQILPIDPQYAGTFNFSSISAPNGWNAIPAPYYNSTTKTTSYEIYTGQLAASTTGGNLIQGIACNYQNGQASWSANVPATIAISQS
jgi:hypothetical protein